MILATEQPLNQSNVSKKIKPKFYPLITAEFVKSTKELKSSELNVLYYIRTLDPYNKGVRICASAIALELGINRSTVSRALKQLDAKQYIDLRILTADVVIKAQRDRPNDVAPTQQNSISEFKKAVQDGTACCVTEQFVAPTQQAPLETHTVSEFQNPKINKINNIKIDLQNKDLNLENSVQNLEPIANIGALPRTPNNSEPNDDFDFHNFIIASIEKQKGIKIGNRQAYLNKILEKDRAKWRSLYLESKRPLPKTRDCIAENFTYLEDSLKMAINSKDYDFARQRLPADQAEMIFAKYPQWRSLLTG